MTHSNTIIGEVFLALFAVVLMVCIKRTALKSVDLDLVQVGQGSGLVSPEHPHVLEIGPDGQCYLDGEGVGVGALEAIQGDGRPVVVACEFDTPAAQAIRWLYDHQVPVYLAVEPGADPRQE